MPTSIATPEVKTWVKAKAANPAQLANPQEKDAITIRRSKLIIEKSLSSLSFLISRRVLFLFTLIEQNRLVNSLIRCNKRKVSDLNDRSLNRSNF